MSRMKAPKSGVRVRMYRQGQGDCFLLAFPRKDAPPDDPVYLLIDCGYMGGSQFDSIKLDEIVAHIAQSTGGFIDYVAITHEHADHVNGFNAKDRAKNKLFDQITFGNLWLSWTESNDDFAKKLRARFNDQLVALALAENHMTKNNLAPDVREDIAQFLDIELGPLAQRRKIGAALAKETAGFAASDKIAGITNKRAIKYLRDTAQNGPEFLAPGQPAFTMAGTAGALVYVLGPPRDEKLLLSLNPSGEEEFSATNNLSLSGETAAFHLAMTHADTPGAASPFAKRYSRPAAEISRQKPAKTAKTGAAQIDEYYARYYYEAGTAKPNAFRRIDGDWLSAAGAMALRLNHEVNNTSLVLAFALPETGKVLLFTGDAQRGNWISWADLNFQVGGAQVSSRELLGRCVFYKCGHHGSHNATLNGRAEDDYANLAWFARGEYAKDFVAMIPVHSKWAREKKRWNHPLPSINAALMKKARGRVIRNDISRVKRPTADQENGSLSDAEWQEFKDLSIEARLYKEYIVLDE